jgi:hypothetical protein
MSQQSPKFMILMDGAFYANELYDDYGRHVYTLEKAIRAAKKFHARKGWEVYNGHEAHAEHYSERHKRRIRTGK